MEKNWVAIYSTNHPPTIAMIKAMLETNNILSVEIDKQASSYNIGELELCVRRENVVKAKYLINKRQV